MTMLAGEARLPYNRPPLSKGLLRGSVEPDAVFVAPAETYDEVEIDVRLDASVTTVDPRARTVTLASGEEVGYERLVLATGSTPRRLGIPGEGLPGVFSYRTLDDALGVQDAARTAGRALIVGAGFIGMETAASLRTLGLGVTVIEPGERLFAALAHPELSSALAQLYRDRGVEVVLGDALTELARRRSPQATRRPSVDVASRPTSRSSASASSRQHGTSPTRVSPSTAARSWSTNTCARAIQTSSRSATSRASTTRSPVAGT